VLGEVWKTGRYPTLSVAIPVGFSCCNVQTAASHSDFPLCRPMKSDNAVFRPTPVTSEDSKENHLKSADHGLLRIDLYRI
jgi:hypothetical protein